jgi:hypothetical protein
MRKFISILNLILAAAAICLTLLVLVSTHTPQIVLTLVICIVWTLCAVNLLRSQRLWSWVGNLVVVSAITLEMGADTLRLLALTWRAEYGDRSVELDPSTIGIPLFFSGLLTVAALFLLAAFLFLPVWPFKKKADV